jgi:hypothetical protein
MKEVPRYQVVSCLSSTQIPVLSSSPLILALSVGGVEVEDSRTGGQCDNLSKMVVRTSSASSVFEFYGEIDGLLMLEV